MKYAGPVLDPVRTRWLCYGLTTLALVLAGLFGVSNSDTFGHLAAGRQIAALGQVPQVDGFSLLGPEPRAWTNYEWLSALLFWGSLELSGFAGLVVFKLVWLALLGWLLVRLSLRLGGERAASLTTLLVLLLLPAARFRLSVRPHLFGLVLTAAYLWLLDGISGAAQDAAGRRRALRLGAALVLLHALWVNLHGSHLLGLLLTLIFLLGRLNESGLRRRLGAVLLGQLLACCVSPYGPRIVLDAIDHVMDPAYRELVSEWSGWTAAHPLPIILSIAAQGVLLLLALRGFRGLGARGRPLLFSALLFGVMAVRSVRFAAEFLLLATPLLAAALSLRFPWLTPRRVALACLPALASAPLVAAQLPPHQAPDLSPRTAPFPAVAAQWLTGQLPGARVLSAMEDGWYLMYAAPGARFVLDGRVPFYGVAHTRRVQRAFASQTGFDELVREFRINAVVVQPLLKEQSGLVARLRQDSRYALVALEERRALFVAAEQVPEGQAFTHLVPGFDMQAVWGEDVQPAALEAELARLPQHANSVAVRAWTRALLQLRPLVRAAGRGGLRPPGNAAERARYGAALAELERVVERCGQLPVVQVLRAAAALGVCRLELAETSLLEAEREGGSREALLLRQELRLRRGQTRQVRDFLQQVRGMAVAEPDPWVEAISAMQAAPPRCD